MKPYMIDMLGNAKKFIAESSIIVLLQFLMVSGAFVGVVEKPNIDIQNIFDSSLAFRNPAGAFINSVEIVGFTPLEDQCSDTATVSCTIAINYNSTVVGNQPVRVNIYASGPDFDNRLIESKIIDPNDLDSFTNTAIFNPETPGFYNFTAEVINKGSNGGKSFSERSIFASVSGIPTLGTLSTPLNKLQLFTNAPAKQSELNPTTRAQQGVPTLNKPLSQNQVEVKPLDRAPSTATLPNNKSEQPAPEKSPVQKPPVQKPIPEFENDVVLEMIEYIPDNVEPSVIVKDGIIYRRIHEPKPIENPFTYGR